MRTIDADYLIDVITKWKNSLSDQKEKKILEEVINCINVKKTVVDINKLIQSIYYEKLDPQDFVDKQDIREANIYNGALKKMIKKKNFNKVLFIFPNHIQFRLITLLFFLSHSLRFFPNCWHPCHLRFPIHDLPMYYLLRDMHSL